VKQAKPKSPVGKAPEPKPVEKKPAELIK